MRKSILFEDATMAYNRWVQGIASRQMDVAPTSLSKLIGLDGRNDQYPNNVKAGNSLHPLLDNTPMIVGDALISLLNLKTKLNTALQSNLKKTKNDKLRLIKAKKQVQKTIDELKITIKTFEQL